MVYNGFYNEINPEDYEQLTMYEKLQFRALKVIDTYNFYYKSSFITVIYLTTLFIGITLDSILSADGRNLKENKRYIQIVCAILKAPFLVTFIIETILRALSITKIKLYNKVLSGIDCVLLLSIIIIGINEIKNPYTLISFIDLMIVSFRLFLQIIGNKLTIEKLQQNENEILEEVKSYHDKLMTDLEKKKQDSQELEAQLEEYLANIERATSEIKQVQEEVLTCHRKSWSSMVAPYISIRVKLPIMHDIPNSKRKSLELNRRERFRNRCRSWDYTSSKKKNK
ncbi:hypothetical protein K502DRAFT_340438 [Neoconidiobolus thromboides FSU 785]|nr:hypothetical protein K502DRAFT_340438 [Neoconidiobolus thromboides FSU 785]